jgi:uncharacterized membrane protein
MQESEKRKMIKDVKNEFFNNFFSKKNLWFLFVIGLSIIIIILNIFETDYLFVTFIKGALSVIFVFLLPGFCLTKVVFKDDEIGFDETLVYSFGLSVLTVSLISLMLYLAKCFDFMKLSMLILVPMLAILAFIWRNKNLGEIL